MPSELPAGAGRVTAGATELLEELTETEVGESEPGDGVAKKRIVAAGIFIYNL